MSLACYHGLSDKVLFFSFPLLVSLMARREFVGKEFYLGRSRAAAAYLVRDFLFGSRNAKSPSGVVIFVKKGFMNVFVYFRFIVFENFMRVTNESEPF